MPEEPVVDTSAAVVNAMTVDVEDYFQVSMFESHVSRDDWASIPCRVEHNTQRILELFCDAGVKATFFMLGWIAERYPVLVREIVNQGHELASHGYAHIRVHRQGEAQFREDVLRTRMLLEDISGAAVKGYRAASYSINHSTPWAYAVLHETGYCYSSSLYPIRHDLYGMPNAPRFAFRPAQGGGIVELPVSTVQVWGRRMPCGGGGYFRLYPYALSRWALHHLNAAEGQAGIFYFHPWEIDPGQPRQGGLPFKVRFRHYLNLRRMENRLQCLLRDFRWDRMDQVFREYIDGHV